MSINLSPVIYTPQVISSQLTSSLTASESQQAALEQQLATGNVVNQPSDNPTATATLMQLNSSLARAKQYASNAADGLGWLSLANSTVNSVMSNLQQARQLVLSISGSALSGQQAAVTGIGDQLTSIRNQILNLANTQYGGQAIFAGTGSVNVAFNPDGTYAGGGNAQTRKVGPGVEVPVSVPGDQVFGSGANNLLNPLTTTPPTTPPTPPGVLATLISDVQSGNLQKAETTDLNSLDAAIQTVSNAAANLGSQYQQMQGFATQATNTQTALESQISAIDGVNLAQVSTQLSQAQQTFQSGLWATAQIESHSLVQYL